ncbi:MAG: ABC transporter ATP-binding protein [Bacteroidetes bacterium]|nr:ABC transporter ATP-binding protein [Bacteroidota bacterium]
MIEIDSLCKTFGKLPVLRNLSATLPAGRATAVIGHNGSGKTTLIKCILGMVIPDSGSIKIDDQEIRNQWEYRNRIGYMPQIGRYPDNMRINQVLGMMKDIRGRFQPGLDEELVHKYALGELGKKSMRTLSGGTRQKVSAALAFMFSPDILILDEPTAGLDPVASEILKDKITESKKAGRTILITSHIMSEVEELADDILYLHNGTVGFYKSIAALKEETGEEKISKALATLLK